MHILENKLICLDYIKLNFFILVFVTIQSYNCVLYGTDSLYVAYQRLVHVIILIKTAILHQIAKSKRKLNGENGFYSQISLINKLFLEKVLNKIFISLL